MCTIEDIFGIKIKTKEFFTAALTHPSFIQDKDFSYNDCYERLEFLGDAVLKLAVSDILFKAFPNAAEGKLTKIRSIVVSDNTLADLAKKNGLQKLIILPKHEEKQGCRDLNSVCACAFEAVLGAYYLDGNLKEIISYIKTAIEPYIEDVNTHFERYNAKEILQEYTQSMNKKTPVYNVIKESGPEHKKIFSVEVAYSGDVLALGEGMSKKDAEQKAAYEACKKLGLF